MDIGQMRITPHPYEPFRLAQAHRVREPLYVSGQTAIDPDGHVVSIGDFDKQANQALESLQRVLHAGVSVPLGAPDPLFGRHPRPVASGVSHAPSPSTRRHRNRVPTQWRRGDSACTSTSSSNWSVTVKPISSAPRRTAGPRHRWPLRDRFRRLSDLHTHTVDAGELSPRCNSTASNRSRVIAAWARDHSYSSLFRYSHSATTRSSFRPDLTPGSRRAHT